MTLNEFDYSGLDRPEVLQTLFHPRSETETAVTPAIIDFEIAVEESISVGGRFHMAGHDDPNILFFHGNDEIASDYDSIGPMFVEVGLSFLAVDYRGYGKSGGNSTVTSMMRDAHVIFKKVKRRLKAENRTGIIIVMGRSLGSASALELAASYPDDIAGLIIDSGFSTTHPFLAALGVDVQGLGLTMTDDFGNVRKISTFEKPTLILHAQHDQLIPIEDAGILHAESPARKKQLQIVPGADHNTIFERVGKIYFQEVKRFTNEICGVIPNRDRYKNRRRKN
ncbi:MAG: alpha/beta hydrolase [Thermodesulfobacteriota bacterium]|nr:alpha/beta hydrolase [Thermodesulfobacteriota bacterium]